MTDSSDSNDTAPASSNGDGSANGAADPAPQPHVQVLGQYVRDLSFENPKAPSSLQGAGENPKMQIEVNVSAKKVADDAFESVINFNAKALNDDGTLYELELIYAGLVKLQNVPDSMLQPVLLINCPSLIFPFLRRLVADITREGGFPPLMLDPIDFNGLYAQNVKKSQEESVKAAAAEPPASQGQE